MPIRNATFLGSFLLFLSIARGAGLSVGSIAIPPDSLSFLFVFGTISHEPTFGVTILLELVPQSGTTGTLFFTTAPPTDVTLAGTPWPDGSFTPFDTDASGSTALNGSVHDDGLFMPVPVTYTGLLSQFPIHASPWALGVWDVRLSTTSGESGWEGVPTKLLAGTVTVGCAGGASCQLYGDHPESPVCAVEFSQCVVDVDDLCCVLEAFQNGLAQCPSADLFPCAPHDCTSDTDCSASVTGPRCLDGACRCANDDDCAALSAPCNEGRQGGRCELADVEDLLAELQAFQGSHLCPHPCPP